MTTTTLIGTGKIEKRLTAPFMYHGGKGHHSEEVTKRFGAVIDVYAEPFAGSLAVLLSRQPAGRELVGDTNGYIANFWRAISRDPHEVAYYADWPVVHDDLTAIHRWLIRWGKDNADKVRDDPEYCDPKAAGRWAWGKSHWIGADFCLPRKDGKTPEVNGIPVAGARSVCVRRDKVPYQGKDVVAAEGEDIFSGKRLLPWMLKIAERMQQVIVLNRSWEALVTNAVLSETEGTVGILLDPPYRMDGRAKTYASDKLGVSEDIAVSSYAWAVEMGEKYRIAYCCGVDDFDVPPGWTTGDERKYAAGSGNKDIIMYSPACIIIGEEHEQGSLF